MNAAGVKADLEQLRDEIGEDFTWNNGTTNKQYRGIFSARTDSSPYEMGGFNSETALSLVCVYADFDIGNPAIGDVIRKDGVNYRITEKTLDPFKVGVEFTLSSEDK